MEKTFHFLQLIAFLFFCACISSENIAVQQLGNATFSCSIALNQTLQSPLMLNHLIYKYAFKSYTHHKTGIMYDVKMPLSKCGFVKLSAIRLRTGRLRSRGIFYNEFEIPPGIQVEPHTSRLLLVYEQFGNGFSNYYTDMVSKLGYKLVAPIFGLLAYECNGHYEEHQPRLWAREKPIKISFEGLNLTGGTKPICIMFDMVGDVNLSNMTYTNVCITHSQGQVSLAVPKNNGALAPSPQKHDKPIPHDDVDAIIEVSDNRLSRKWRLEMGILVGGFVLLGITWLVMFWIVRQRRKSKFMKMETEADQGEALQTYMFGFNRRAPAAHGLRTQPVLENEYHT